MVQNDENEQYGVSAFQWCCGQRWTTTTRHVHHSFTHSFQLHDITAWCTFESGMIEVRTVFMCTGIFISGHTEPFAHHGHWGCPYR